MVSNEPVDDSMAYILAENGILNVASAFLNMNGEVEIRIFNSFTMSVNVITSPTKLSLIFPDKLELHDHKNLITFMENHTEKINENAKSLFITMNDLFTNSKYTRKNKTLSLNKFKLESGVPHLQTYDLAGICALIPNKPRKSKFNFALSKPINNPVRLCYWLLLIASILVWRMYKV